MNIGLVYWDRMRPGWVWVGKETTAARGGRGDDVEGMVWGGDGRMRGTLGGHSGLGAAGCIPATAWMPLEPLIKQHARPPPLHLQRLKRI